MADDTCEEVLRYFFTDSLNYSSQQVLHLGITLLNMFVQANFTGPEIPTDFPEFNSIYPFKWFSSVYSTFFTSFIDFYRCFKTFRNRW